MYELDNTIKLHQDYALIQFQVGERTNDEVLKRKSLDTIISCIDLNNLQEHILKNTLEIITSLREQEIDISTELSGVKKIMDSITTKELKELIEQIKERL